MTLSINIVGWVAWALDVFLAISFTRGCRMCVKRGQQFQWLTALQTTIFWIVAAVFLLLPVPKVHIVWILLLAYLHLIVLWLVTRSILPAGVLRIPFPASIILWLPFTKLFVALFMRILLLGVRAERRDSADPSPP